MGYFIDFKDNFKDTLLFWIEKYTYSKLNSLSNHQVNNKNEISKVMNIFRNGIKDIETLSLACKKCRNVGIIGINTYINPLIKLYDYLLAIELESMKDIDEELLKEFLTIHTSSLSDASKKNHRMALINFFSFIDKQNSDDNGNSHTFKIELKNWNGLRGKSGNKLPAYMNENEIKRFIDSINTFSFKHKYSNSRNRLILKIIIYTGIRVGEALNLKPKDIMPENDNILKIIVRGKGNKQRMVLIKKEHIYNDLKEWLELRNNESEFLFCNNKGQKITQAFVSRIVETILMSSGIRKDKNGAHMLRHSFATLLYQKSQDLILVQEALGHASLETSRIYTHFDINKLKATTEII
ncbi:tyrosine-type recombinase/integrase [Helicobacter ibis]|uniref:Tyrosine recombinase XerH n=1 Tax=Helicobacter ibis TaxID=2962633 RepID=A0ABT4VDE2_9HELI|nr:tyrosine-type recombinase/integrase [Helicobacter ibis]MDA3968717.1 tyrosine-type recombinase/integrase [Helicobacter ibis]